MHRLLLGLAGAGIPRGRLFGPGDVRLALLSLLVDEPSHGYSLMTRVESRCEGAYQASAGTIYPTLQLLEDEGLIEASEREGRRVYRATAAGRREAAAKADAIDAIWRRASELGEWGPFTDPRAAEILRPALHLAKAAIKAVVKAGADPAVVDNVRRILDSARADIERVHKRSKR